MVCLQVFRRSFEIAATVHSTPNAPQKNAFLFTCLEPQKLKNLQTFYKLHITQTFGVEKYSTSEDKTIFHSVVSP